MELDDDVVERISQKALLYYVENYPRKFASHVERVNNKLSNPYARTGRRQNDGRRSAVDRFNNSLGSGTESWHAIYGPLTPRLVLELTRLLPFVDVREHSITPVNRVLMFLERMHSCLSFAQIVDRYGTTMSTVKSVFYDTLELLILHVGPSAIHLPCSAEAARIRLSLIAVASFPILCKTNKKNNNKKNKKHMTSAAKT